MRPSLRHLRDPLRSARTLIRLAVAGWRSLSLCCRGHLRYRGDPRYDLANLRRGLLPHPADDDPGETAMLERICAAYSEALRRERAAPEAYRATPWWEAQRRWSLRPVIQALEHHDTPALRRMYGNFFRDPCSAGLIVLQSRARDLLADTRRSLDRRLLLIDHLYRMDYWREQSGGRFRPDHLAAPPIGNPFGVYLDGNLIRIGSEYHHSCAHRISSLMPEGHATVVEIGGGYGGMAYYLLRDRPLTRYVDFDVPETCALAAYHLLRALPGLRIALCGEADSVVAAADIVLLPLSELGRMPSGSARMVFSSHAMSDLPAAAVEAYGQQIDRIACGRFLYAGTGAGGRMISAFLDRHRSALRLTETRRSGWLRHAAPAEEMVEYLFERDPSGRERASVPAGEAIPGGTPVSMTRGAGL